MKRKPIQYIILAGYFFKSGKCRFFCLLTNSFYELTARKPTSLDVG